MRAFARFIRDNGLSIAFGTLFLLSIVGQALAGYAAARHGSPTGIRHPAGLRDYVGSADFLKGVFSNWQAAVLQLLVLVVLAVFLRQRGASHSRKFDDEVLQRRRERLRWFGKPASWTYANSLSLALLALFVASFAIFTAADLAIANRDHAARGEAVESLAGFARSAGFWFDVLQTWQAEFFAMGVFLVLSIFLRQEGSAESKPVGASDQETGETNQ